jgi:tagatose 6-phosphate kinase
VITVLCANPALDVTYRVDRLTPGDVHAVYSVQRRAGGKGTNVARVLRQLGEAVRLVAPLGGTDGERYAAEIAESGIELVAVPVGAPPRTSVCVLDEDATVFNEAGPELAASEWDAVVDAVLQPRPDVLVLSGSLPAGVPTDAYARLIRPDVVTVVDAKGPVLAAALTARPHLVAPNVAEAQDILGAGDAAQCAAGLRSRGAGSAVVSCGPDGLVAATSDGTWIARPPRALSGNPTGAGDALTAALAAGLARAAPWPDLVRDAVATSAAALGRDTAGEIDLDLRAELLGQVVIEEVRDAADQHS